MTDNRKDRPLVTFALFAYNQEEYIREAIESAFAQTYEPLEILLSDDCSSDRTFQIMQQMENEYSGPHAVRSRKNLRNVGTIDHVILLSREAKGDFIVVAAGDDKSYPQRTARLAQEWQKNQGYVAIFSNADIIDKSGVILKKNFSSTYKSSFQDILQDCHQAPKYKNGYRNIPGYSASYKTKILQSLPLSDKNLLNEDSLLSYYTHCLGGEIGHVEEGLLGYRNALAANSRALRLNEIADNIKCREIKQAKFAKSTQIFYPYLFATLRRTSSSDAEHMISRLEPRRRLAAVQSFFISRSVFGRIDLVLKNPSLIVWRYCIPRLFGLRVFSFIKAFFERPKK